MKIKNKRKGAKNGQGSILSYKKEREMSEKRITQYFILQKRSENK